jgi:hypothetical protein
MKYFLAALVLMGASVAARASTILSYTGTALDNTQCTGKCHFTHVQFSVQLYSTPKPYENVRICAGEFCSTLAQVTFSDGESRLTMANKGQFLFEGEVTMDATGKGVSSASMSISQSRQQRPTILWYAGISSLDGDSLGGSIGKTTFTVQSDGPGSWKLK